MIFFILFVQYNIGNCIHQLNPLQDKPYFQSLNKLFDLDELDVKIEGPSLGFEIQGGIVKGSEKKLNMQNSTIISTSFAELNTLAILSFYDQYRVDLLQINYDRQLEAYNENLFQISNHKCQYIKNLHFYRVMVHCLAENNEVIIFFYTTEVTKHQTSHIMNDAEMLKSVNIQIKQDEEFFHDLVIYVNYVFSDHAEVYEMIFGESVSFQLIWNQSEQYNQISVSNQQIFTLHSDCVSAGSVVSAQSAVNTMSSEQLMELQNYQHDEESYLAMSIEYLEQFHVVYVVTNYSIIIFNEKLFYLSDIKLPYIIDQAQLYGNNNHLYLLTNNSTLIYEIQKYGLLFLHQYSNQSLLNNLGVYGKVSDIFITFEQNVMNTYQIFDYSIYNPSPKESGILNLSLYSIDNEVDFKQIYINLLQNYNKLEVVSTQFQNQYIFYDNYSEVQIKIKDYFEGPNIEQLIRSQLDYFTFQDIGPPQLQFNNAQILLAYPQDKLSGYLTLNVTNQVFQINFYYYDNTNQSIWESQSTISDNIQKILITTTKSQEILALLMNNQSIQVYQIIPLNEVSHRYEMSISYFSYQLNINKTISFENQLLIHNGWGYEYFLLFLDNHYYVGSRGQYDFVSIQRKESIGIFFQSEYFKIDIDNYDLFKWSYDQRIYFDNRQQDHILYAIPLDQCMIQMATNIIDTQLFYFDNIYKIKDIGQKYRYQINVEGLIFQPSQLAYSNKHFYIWVQSQETQDNYIYVFGCFDNQINQPKKVIPINGPIQRISAYSSFGIEADFLTYQIDNTTYIYQMAFESKLLVSPKQQQDEVQDNQDQDEVQDNQDQDEVNKVEDESNENSEIEIQSEQQQQNLTVTINDDIINILGQLQNEKIDSNSGQLIMNPYDFFDGAIYYYSIQCENCDSFNFTPIIQIYGNYTKNSQCSFINQSDNNQLYIQSTHEIYSYDLTALPQQQSQENEQASIYKIWENGNNKILLTFIDIKSQSLSWIYQDGLSIYVYSMIKNEQTTSKFIANTSNIFMVIYQEGFLQLGFDNTYNCYYYSIENDTQIFNVVAQNIKVSETNYNDPPFLILAKNQYYVIFGTLLIDVAQKVYGMVLNVTLSDYQLKSYDIFNLDDSQLDKTLTDLQSLTLLQIEVPKYQTDTFINIAYTTSSDAGRIKLLFYKMKFIHFRFVCNFDIPYLFKDQQIKIRITTNDYQIAILNEVELMNEKVFYISMYLGDDSQCFKNNFVKPYAFLLIDNPVIQIQQQLSIKYLSQNHLLLSYGQGSILYYIQKYLTIDYSTNGDAEINIKAHNIQDQLLYKNDRFYKANSQSQPDSIYILLFILISVFTLLSIIFLILYRKIKIQKTKGQAQTHNESIEVPSE